MAEPTGSQMPGAYDDTDSLLGELLDHRSFKLNGAIEITDTTIVTQGSLGDIDLPVYIVFDDQSAAEDNEIIYCDDITVGGNGFENVLRGVRNTVAQAHATSAKMYIAYTGRHATLMLKAILAAQKYQALVGPTTGIPGTPVAGEVYIDEDADKVFMAVDNTASPEFRQYGIVDHGEYQDLDADDHNIGTAEYHNDARALSWHSGQPGAHVQDGDSHDHLKGDGAGRIQAGPYSGLGSASNEREIYYDTDNDELYVANASLTWIKITGAPIDAIAMFRGPCPSGWTRVTGLDSRFPPGCETGEDPGDYIPQTEGSDTHSHTYSDVPQHLHTVASFAGSTNSVGDHNHTMKTYSGTSGSGYHEDNLSGGGNLGISSAGNHDHEVDMPSDSTDSSWRTSDDAASVAQGTTTSDDAKPPYYEVVFCKKD